MIDRDMLAYIIVSSASLADSLFSLFFTVHFSKTRFKLTQDRFNCVFSWFSKTLETINVLEVSKGSDNKKVLLAELSAYIDEGRFYFPNIDLKDGFGADKEFAYQGYRNFVLDTLVYLYGIFSSDDFTNYKANITILKRLFVSCVFKHLNVKKLQKSVLKNTDFLSQDFRLEDLLAQDPEIILQALSFRFDQYKTY